MEIKVTKRTATSLNEIEAVLAELPNAFQDSIYSDMCFAVAQRFTRVAKASPRFKDRTGKLRKSFRTVRIDTTDGGRDIKDGGARAIMGGRTAPHGHLIELGTDSRTQTSTGRATGSVSARNMLGDAFDSEQTAATEAGFKAAKRNFNRFIKVAQGRGKLTKRQTAALTRR